MARLNEPFPETASLQFSNEGESRVSTRSMTRTRTQQTPTTPNQSTPNQALNHLLALFSQHFHELNSTNISPTINEEEADDVSVLSTSQPTNLINNPAYSANQQSQQPTEQSIAQSFHTAMSSQSSQSTGEAFACEFGGPMMIHELWDLERNRAQIIQPLLEKEYASVKCTAISRHMWGHTEPMNFTTKGEMYAWICSKWEVSIVSKSNVITNTNNKTARTKRTAPFACKSASNYLARFMRKIPNTNWWISEQNSTPRVVARRSSYCYPPLG